jgi:hypothetical protein
MKHLALLLTVGILAITGASAQFDLLAPFAPRDCFSAARNAAGGAAANARLVSLISVGFPIPVDSTAPPIDLSLNPRDGRARLWIYAFIAGANDSVVTVPMVRLLIACQDARTLLGGGEEPDIPIDGIGNIPLPSNYIEGSNLANRLNGNANYQQFRTAHPDSTPSFVLLTMSPEEAFGFPAQTPLWLINWSPFDGEPNLDSTGAPFVCLVHATTGETICGVDIFTSVQEVEDGAVMLAPNPSTDHTTVSLPTSWVGSFVTIEAIDPSGQVTTLNSNLPVASPIVSVSTSTLAAGAYMLRVHSSNANVVLPLRVVK